MKQALNLAARLLPALALCAAGLVPAARAAGTEIVDIHWSGDGRFAHQASVAPGQFVELCGKLPAGLAVRWRFEAGAPLEFNIHYHQGKAVVFPTKLSAATKAGDTLNTQIEQDYCWMWSNKAATPATLSAVLQR